MSSASRRPGAVVWLQHYVSTCLHWHAEKGAVASYLQVEADNHPARRIYQRLGFADAYAYHYRVAP